ncbi:DNA methylase [Clostridiaceae bacterium]|nr:DNA methylase [Clostridiaceae bacterium]RKI10038.1 DNA methylase [bacterium 1XD21-70]
MPPKDHIYAAIDLKSFYASAECIERGLDPLTTNLVVADKSRTKKTICLAVSPSLKAYGIPGRPRLFEVVQAVDKINSRRILRAPGQAFSGSSYHDPELKTHPELALGYITATPRMSLYMEYSTRIYGIYLKYIAPEDIHVYSIDEVMIDLTGYLSPRCPSARDLVGKMIRDVQKSTGITAAAGIGTNLYLAKVAMDIVAKHVPADGHNVRIAELDEMSYRRLLWTHRPLTDFWRIGHGYAAKLEEHGLSTMGDIARCSLGKPGDFHNEELLYRLFGINAELLIDHAWGLEPCTMADIKAYRPESSSIGGGQILPTPYPFDKARLVVKEMADQLALDLVGKGLVAGQLILTAGYDMACLTDPQIRQKYKGAVTTDRYGRKVPKHAHGTTNLPRQTSSARLIIRSALELFDQIADRNLLVKRIYITAAQLTPEASAKNPAAFEQLDLFTDYGLLERQRRQEESLLQKEKRLQQAMLSVKKKFGKNAILKGMSLEEGATARERNQQIGGHKA